MPTLHCCGLNLVWSSGLPISITIATMLCQNIGIWTLICFRVIQLLDLSHLNSPAHQNIFDASKKNLWCAQDEMVVLSNLNSLTQSVHSHTRCLARLPLGRLLPLVGWLAQCSFLQTLITTMI